MNDVLGAGKAIEKLLDPVVDLVKKLAGPAAEEVGLSLQDSVKVWRAKRQYRLFEKMDAFIREAGFEPKPIGLKVLLPSLDFASVEDDEDLHTTWATMLSNAADPRRADILLPLFPLILREITTREVRFLACLHELVLCDNKTRPFSSPWDHPSRIKVSHLDMKWLFITAVLGEPLTSRMMKK